MAAFQLDANIPLLARANDTSGLTESFFGNFGQAGELKRAEGSERLAALADAENKRQVVSVATGAKDILGDLEAGNFKAAEQTLERRIEDLTAKAQGGQSDPRQFKDTLEALNAIKSGDATRIKFIKDGAKKIIGIAESQGLIQAGGTGKRISADQLGFDKTIEKFTEDEKIQARKVRAGIVAKAGSSADERIARDKELSDQILELTRDKAEAKETGKGKGQAKVAPLVAEAKATIATAVTLATKAATARGEALSDLRKAEAGMPGIIQVVDKLKELAPLATSTIAGKVFDFAVKESGFGATKGGTARSTYQAVVSNQVLPLLKQTFGAAMTEGEGLRLTATLGDPDAPVETKMAQLDAFLASQQRQIENLNRETDETQGQAVQSQDTGITAEQFRAMTPAQRAGTLREIQAQQGQ